MNLWESSMPFEKKDVDFVPTIDVFEADSDGAVIVFPGGGYSHRAAHEGNTIGEWFQSNGVTAFVVQYRVTPYTHPAPLSDAMRAVRYVRANADKYHINKDKIAVMGFSAGGHLAGSVSVHYDKDVYEATDEIDNVSARPNASILCYPVIDMYNFRHDGSRAFLLGSRPKKSDADLMSLHKQINENTPPAFLWHTANDGSVPVENSLLYSKALASYNIPFELHIYPDGPHGLGLSIDRPYTAQWSAALINWLKLLGYKNE